MNLSLFKPFFKVFKACRKSKILQWWAWGKEPIQQEIPHLEKNGRRHLRSVDQLFFWTVHISLPKYLSIFLHSLTLDGHFKSFQVFVPLLYPLKTSENLWFSDLFRVYRKGRVAWKLVYRVLTSQNRWRLTSFSQSKPISQSSLDMIIFLS